VGLEQRAVSGEVRVKGAEQARGELQAGACTRSLQSST